MTNKLKTTALHYHDINPEISEFLSMATEYREMMMRYECALLEIKTKLEVLNVGCDTYEIVRYYPMPGCSWRISLNYKL